MKSSIAIRPRLFLFLFVLLPIIGCTHQEIVNSPCATLNATVQIKPSANLSLMFGNDAIKAAIDAVAGQITKSGDTSVPSLTNAGKDAALKTAKANGKNPSMNDIDALETYLSKDVVPAIRQNPTCNFTLASSGRPYVGIDRLHFRNAGVNPPFLMMGVKNTGQAEANTRITIRQILDGKEHTSNSFDIVLVPNIGRTISLKDPPLPVPDIDSGKAVLIIAVDISYPIEDGTTPALHREAWQYDHVNKEFYSFPLK